MKEIKLPKIESKIEDENVKNFLNFLIVNAFTSRFSTNSRNNYYLRNQNNYDNDDDEYNDNKNFNF